MTHPVESEVEDGGYVAAPAPEAPSALPAGAIGLPRSRYVIAGVGGVVALIAAVGIGVGMSKSRHTDLGDSITIESGKTVPAPGVAQATPVMQLAGAEPGSDPIGTPTGDPNPPPASDKGTVLTTPSQPTQLVAPDGSGPLLQGPRAGRETLVRPRDRDGPDDAGAVVTDQPRVASTEAGGVPLACLSPRNHMQSLMCSDPHLAAADARVRQAFRRALAESDDPDALQAEQARWRAARDRAADRNDAGALADLYSNRIKELEPR